MHNVDFPTQEGQVLSLVIMVISVTWECLLVVGMWSLNRRHVLFYAVGHTRNQMLVATFQMCEGSHKASILAAF